MQFLSYTASLSYALRLGRTFQLRNTPWNYAEKPPEENKETAVDVGKAEERPHFDSFFAFFARTSTCATPSLADLQSAATHAYHNGVCGVWV